LNPCAGVATAEINAILRSGHFQIGMYQCMKGI